MKALILSLAIIASGLTQAQRIPAADKWAEECAQQSTGSKQITNSRAVTYLLIARRSNIWDMTNSVWVGSDSSIYTHDDAGREVTSVNKTLSNGNWNNYSQYINTYTPGGKLDTAISNQWVNHLNKWRATDRYVYSFQGEYLTESTRQTWDTAGGNWINASRTINMYDANNNMDTMLHQSWLNNKWDDYILYTYTYDANKNVLNYTYHIWAGYWLNSSRYNYSYNGNNKLAHTITEAWNSIGMEWQNYSKTDYTYDGNLNNIQNFGYNWIGGVWDTTGKITRTFTVSNKLVEYIQQQKFGGTWANYDRSLNTYNSSDLTEKSEYWNWVSNAWKGSIRTNYEYDAQGNNTYTLHEQFKDVDMDYHNNREYYYYYQPFNVTAITETKNELNATLFPNPSTSANVHVNFKLTENSVMIFTVYNAQGQKVSMQQQPVTKGTNNIALATASLSTGNYFIQAIDISAGKTSVLLFVKQ